MKTDQFVERTSVVVDPIDEKCAEYLSAAHNCLSTLTIDDKNYFVISYESFLDFVGESPLWKYRFTLQALTALDQPKREEKGMNDTTKIFLLNDEVRAVRGTYEPGGKIELFKTFDKTIKKDDLIVIPASTRHNFTVAKVTEIDVTVDLDDSEKVRWIVSKVDLADYEALVKNEEVGIEKLRKAEFAKRRRTIFQDLVDSEDKAEITSLPIYSGKDKTAAEQPQPAAAKPIV